MPKTKKAAYPVPDGGLKEIPENFDPQVHKPLIQADFAVPWLFFDHKADQAKKAMAEYEKLAQEERKKAASRHISLKQRMERLSAKIALCDNLDPSIKEAAAKEHAKMVEAVKS